MKNIKEAWKLIKFEYKMTPPSYMLVLFLFAISLFFLVSIFTESDVQGTLGTEFFFFFIVVGIPYMIRSKHLQPQNIGLKEHIPPVMMLLQTMPISKRTIALYRMISYTGVSLIYNTVFFSLFYLFSPYMRSIASPSTYIVFAIMWICFAIYVGGYQVNMEAGYHLLTYIFFLFFIWLPLFGLASIYVFYNNYTFGLIQWMLDVSGAYPIIIISTSVIFAVIGFFVHLRGFIKRMNRINY